MKLKMQRPWTCCLYPFILFSSRFYFNSLKHWHRFIRFRFIFFTAKDWSSRLCVNLNNIQLLAQLICQHFCRSQFSTYVAQFDAFWKRKSSRRQVVIFLIFHVECNWKITRHSLVILMDDGKKSIFIRDKDKTWRLAWSSRVHRL